MDTSWKKLVEKIKTNETFLHNLANIIENVTEINLRLTGINDELIGQLAPHFKKLKNLNISYNDIENISALAYYIPNLNKLNASHCNIIDLIGIGKAKNLEYLDLSANRQTRYLYKGIYKISPADIEYAPDLAKYNRVQIDRESITVRLGWKSSNDEKYKGRKEVTGPVLLREGKSGGNYVRDLPYYSGIAPLAELPALTHLILAGNQIDDIACLTKDGSLPNLKYIDLKNNPLDKNSRAISLLRKRGVEVNI